MRRLSIEVTPEQRQRLKAIAALHGQTLKDYVLERALLRLPETESLSEEDALQQLKALLQPRIEETERGEVVAQSVEQIFAGVNPAGQKPRILAVLHERMDLLARLEERLSA